MKKIKLILVASLSVFAHLHTEAQELSNLPNPVGIKKISTVKPSPIRPMDSVNALGNIYEEAYTTLPDLATRGQVNVKLWSDYYWPDTKGGIAFRWQYSAANDPRPSSPLRYNILSANQVYNMSDAQIAELSPAEKFDIMNGWLNFPTVINEINRTQYTQESWAGLCHAVAQANLIFEEPRQQVVSVRIGDRIKNVVFYSSDIKALLAQAVSLSRSAAYTVGSRCNNGTISNNGACWDTNPASFFLVLTNSIGEEKRPVIIDVDATTEIWNSVVQSYSASITPMKLISLMAAPGTVRQVKVDLSIQHALGVKPSKAQSGAVLGTKNYSFSLELDKHNEIIGGEWISTERPDFVWVTDDYVALPPYFQSLSRLVKYRYY